jgi:hypothetical protein
MSSVGLTLNVCTVPAPQRRPRIYVVWFPPWDPSLMSEAARNELWG